MTHDKKQTLNIYVPPALRKTCPETDSIKNKNLSEDIVNNNNQNLSGLQRQLERLTVSSLKSFGSSSATSNSSKNFEKKTNSLGKHILSNSNSSNLREPPCLNYDNYRHILEFYNFSKDVQTCQFEAELVGFENSGFYLKWVDDIHCLAVFSSDNEANRALSQISGLFMKARRIPEASIASKWKLARSPGDWPMPYKKRPLTTSMTARRLISNHLGIRSRGERSEAQINREIEDKNALREARERAEVIRKAQKAIWESD